jgi:hypothetical protein
MEKIFAPKPFHEGASNHDCYKDKLGLSNKKFGITIYTENKGPSMSHEELPGS